MLEALQPFGWKTLLLVMRERLYDRDKLHKRLTEAVLQADIRRNNSNKAKKQLEDSINGNIPPSKECGIKGSTQQSQTCENGSVVNERG